jgi:hypothetical protein
MMQASVQELSDNDVTHAIRRQLMRFGEHMFNLIQKDAMCER